MTKQKWLDIAEVIDAFRVIPRTLLIAYGIFYLWYIEHVTSWYFEYMAMTEKIDIAAVTGSTGFVTATITALGGMFTWFAGNVYMKTGRTWGKIQKEDVNDLLEKLNAVE